MIIPEACLLLVGAANAFLLQRVLFHGEWYDFMSFFIAYLTLWIMVHEFRAQLDFIQNMDQVIKQLRDLDDELSHQAWESLLTAPRDRQSKH